MQSAYHPQVLNPRVIESPSAATVIGLAPGAAVAGGSNHRTAHKADTNAANAREIPTPFSPDRRPLPRNLRGA